MLFRGEKWTGEWISSSRNWDGNVRASFRFVQIFFKFKTDEQSCMKIVLLKIDRLRLKFLEIDRLNTRVHGKKEEFEKLVRNWITLFIIIIIFLLY